MAEARDFRNSSSCGVENKLKAMKLTARKIEKEKVVDLRMSLILSAPIAVFSKFV